VTSIGSYAFRRCHNLTSMHLPDNLTKIGSSAFAFCGELFINFDHVINFGENAFEKTRINVKKKSNVEELDFKELPKDSHKVISYPECHDQFDAVSLERLEVGETVFAVPAGSKIYCFSIATVWGMVRRDPFHEFVHPISRKTFNGDQMSSFKKIIVIRDELDQKYHDFQQQVIDEIENDTSGNRTRMYI